MKTVILFLSLIFIGLTGCSITHNITDYPSDKKFYEDYNNSARGKSVNITLQNDTTVYRYNNTEVENDTLYNFERAVDEKEYKLPTGEIKKIHYLTNDYKTAGLVLNNDVRLKGKNLFITRDSISFWGMKEQTVKYNVSSVNNIKIISYKNPWKGVIPGILGGVLLGGVLGSTGWIYNPKDGGNTPTFDQFQATIAGALTGFLIGPVIGYLIGFNISYLFSP